MAASMLQGVRSMSRKCFTSHIGSKLQIWETNSSVKCSRILRCTRHPQNNQKRGLLGVVKCSQYQGSLTVKQICQTQVISRSLFVDKSTGRIRKGRLTVVSVGGFGTVLYIIFDQLQLQLPKPVISSVTSLYRKIPLNSISRLWGRINEKELPLALRKPLLGLYVWCFAVDLSEASDEDLTNYRNLGEFFRRTLKPHLRSVDENHCLTSPADGRVLHYGVVEHGVIEQVKGVTYSLQGFLGPPVWSKKSYDHDVMSDEDYNKTLNIKPGNKLFHCVVYLAPGDYHRFHSASDWTVNHRRHFPGDLLSVNPWVAHWLEDLFKLNERVVYSGTWKYGFFAYIPVGATNVGSIKVYCDSDLVTNTFQHDPNVYFDKSMCTSDQKGLKVGKGEMFGEFNLGSTIVLLFEAPETFKFNITNGQKVRFGQPLGDSP